MVTRLARSARMARAAALLSVPFCALLPAAAAAASFTLDFAGERFQPVPQDFGDNALVDLSYRAIAPTGYGDVATLSDLRHWPAGFGDLAGAVYSNGAPSHAEIRIEARDPAGLVTLEGFDLGGWWHDQDARWLVFDLNWTLLGQGAGIAPEDGGHWSVSPGISAGGGLILQWGENGYDVGLNNLAFSVTGALAQAIATPVPAAAPLLAAALGLLVLRRRA